MNARLSARAAMTLLLLTCGGPGAASTSPPMQVPQADHRTEDQTYLTFPEWFLVFSPDEYAASLEAGQSPSAFPFFGHIGQFWGAYRQVAHATHDYTFNGEYHTMIGVIGVSTTLEYAIKSAYETLIGRVSELGAPANSTPEDRLATQQARDYVEFVRVRPWYEFDFIAPLKQLWTQTPWWGADPLRKWERRYLLTSEWLVKAGYAAGLKRATQSTFEIPSTQTLAVVDDLPADIETSLPELHRLQHAGARTVISVPRYQAFTDQSMMLARRGVRFVDIAGNRGTILVSIVSPTSDAVPAAIPVLIRQPILTRPRFERRVLQVPVPRLSEVLNGYAGSQNRIEHVFDY